MNSVVSYYVCVCVRSAHRPRDLGGTLQLSSTQQADNAGCRCLQMRRVGAIITCRRGRQQQRRLSP
jgi:hypothetical protein